VGNRTPGKEAGMAFTIEAPTSIEHPLYEDRLEIVESEEQVRRSAIRQQLSDMAPVVTLGQPQWWSLARLAREKGESLPAEMALSLGESDFFLLQLAFSLLPHRDERVIWARFDIDLQPSANDLPPLAFDLYPREIYDEVESDRQIAIEPSLSFATFEAKLGKALTTIHFRKLEPVVVGYGLLQSHCGWDYQRSHQKPLTGIQVGYLIVKKPLRSGAVRAIMDVRAEVSTPTGLFGTRVTERDRARLTVALCAE
jgi:hypothetical protein